MFKNNSKFALTISAILLATSGFALQPPPPPVTPIDSGLSVLLAIGVGYGVKKLRDYTKQ